MELLEKILQKWQQRKQLQKQLQKQSQQLSQNQKQNRVLNNSNWINTPDWVDFFLREWGEYYELYKTFWPKLQVLIDRINFYYLWTNKLLRSEEEKEGFEHWLEVLMELLAKNVDNLDATREEKRDTSKQKMF